MVYSSLESMRIDLEYQKELVRKIGIRLRKLKKWNGCYLAVRRVRNNRYYYLVKRKDKKEKLKYLGKSDNEVVQQIQEMHYLKLALKSCNRNIKTLQKCIKAYMPFDPETLISKSGAAYRDNVDVGWELFGIGTPNQWKEEGLEKRRANEDDRPYPEALTLLSSSGERMRSRGEVIIGNAMDMLDLVWIYELPRFVENKLRWPDFTVYDKNSDREIIIEYMGMYGDAGYREKNSPKIEEYFDAGFVLGQNLFIFMDDADGNIDSNTIIRVLKSLFY